MPHAVKAYVRLVDAITEIVGKIVMYGIFALTALLLYATISRTVFNHPLIWAVETGQFMMTAYWFLGGAYTILLRGHVRMDLLYSSWSPRRQGMTDVATDLCLIFYLLVLLAGGVNSTLYALEYHQVKRSIWAPPMAPIKITMCIGILLMILQSFSVLFKDWAKARGETI